MSGIFGFVVYKVAQARRMKVKGGPEQLIGKTGTAVSSLNPRGEVRVEGQIWRAETVTSTVKEGELVEIVGREGLILRVKPKQTEGEGLFLALVDFFLGPGFIAGIIVVLFIVILIASGIRVIKEWERAPVLRLGRFTGLKGPGLFYIIPFVDRIPNIVSMRVQTVPFRTEQH